VYIEPPAKDVRELAQAFNQLHERLEDERRDSARRAVRAQEAERRRLARELHDELGQSPGPRDHRNARAGAARPRAALGRPRAHDGHARAPGGPRRVTTPLRTRVLVADDHAVVRHGVRRILAAEPDFEVIAEAGDGAEAVATALALRPDLVILDVSMPRLTGLQAAGELGRRAPGIRLLMLSMHDDEQYLFEALRAGASGYVLKSGVDRDLVEAARATMRGESFLYPDAAAALIKDRLARAAAGEAISDDPLTPRETEVLKLIAEAHTNQGIAQLLVISEKTVENHRARILEKLGMRDRVELTRYAIRRGLVQP
jgi:DNA-binding NarL/FixJ family response regulator